MAATGAKSSQKAPVDYLQDALKDLDKAREKAGEEAGANIDAAIDRIGEVRGDLTTRGQGQLSEWQEQLEEAAEDVRRELGRWAIRAQRTPEALTELSAEITKRRKEITG